jgi:hypothetical protein
VVAMLFGVVLSNLVIGQCAEGQISLSMNIYTDSWPYETYWELVPGTNVCGDGTMAWGSNQVGVGCSGVGDPNGNGGNSNYPGNAVVEVTDICLNYGEFYTLYFVDSYGDGGLYFEMFEDNAFSGFYGGTGFGNAWTFQAGVSFLGPHDSPCSALEIIPGSSSAVELSNINCYAQVAEVHAPQGNCAAMGVWCADEINHTVWAKFTVPDDGSYEISTVNNGTIINTQMAVWYAEDCSDMSSFIYLSGNDNFIGESGIEFCNANPPICVDQASAAYSNVLSIYPDCCVNGWDDACQALYDEMNTTCINFPQTCSYILEGYDSYGDGWNGGYVIVTIDGVESTYTLTEGNYALWSLDVMDGSQLSVEFVGGDWPEEVYVSLKHPDGFPLVAVQAITVDPMLFDNVVGCNGVAYYNPQASRCYVHCLPAGITCYVQIDGYNNEMGQVILSIKPYQESAATNAVLQNVLCPVAVGNNPEGMILPNITGWGLNYEMSWSGPNGFSSDAYFLENIGPGDYIYHAEDACGNSIDEVFVIEGPSPYLLETESVGSCLENQDGSVSFSASGGTAPYEYYWIYPDLTEHAGEAQESLSPGIYTLYLEDANDCPISVPVVVEEFLQPTFSLGEDMEMCNDFNLMLTGPDASTYNWSTGGQQQSIIISNDDFPIGTYEISLEVSNEFGCVYSDVLNLVVMECVNVDENEIGQMLIYPLPANNELHVVNLPKDAERLTITDLMGNLVVNENVNQKENLLLNVSDLASGNYFISIQCVHEIMNRQLIIER